MKRAGVFVFFNKDGIVHRYVPYLLDDMMKNLSELVIVVNGKVNDEGKKLFEGYTKHIIIRENKGLDTYGYREGMAYFGWDVLEEYDEVVIFNDTIMGPVYPFAEMFGEMEKRDVDFWGITRHYTSPINPFSTKYGYTPEHIQSYFMVFRQRFVQSSEFRAYWDNLPVIRTYMDAVGKHEIIFTKHFADLGFKYDTYIHSEQIKIYAEQLVIVYGDRIVMQERCPIFKKRLFFCDYEYEMHFNTGQVACRLLDYLKNETDYPTEYILESMLKDRNLRELFMNFHWNYILPLRGEKRTCDTKVRAALIGMGNCGGLESYTDTYAGRLPEEAELIIVREGNWTDGLRRVLEAAPEYDVVGFIHESAFWKADEPTVEENAFLKEMDCLLGSKTYVQQAIRLFEQHDKLGALAVPEMNHGHYHSYEDNRWGDTFDEVLRWMDELHLSVPVSAEIAPIVMPDLCFWMSSEAIMAISEKMSRLLDEINEGNEARMYATLQRLLPLILQQSGFYTAKVTSDISAGAELDSLWYQDRFNGEAAQLIRQLEESVSVYRDSNSWRLMAPMRILGRIARSVRDRSISTIEWQSDNLIYALWIRRNEAGIKMRRRLPYEPLFSVIVNLDEAEESWIKACVRSVQRQTYPKWQLLLIDNGLQDRKIRRLLHTFTKDERIRVISHKRHFTVASAYNDAIAVAEGEFAGFLEVKDTIAPNALYEMALYLNQHRKTDMIYSDEDRMTANGEKRHDPFFKPDWSPDTFMSMNYVEHFSVYRMSVLKKAGGLRREYDGAETYDLAFRFMECSSASRVGHIAKVLYHNRDVAEPGRNACPDAVGRVKEAALERRGIKGDVIYDPEIDQYNVIYEVKGEPLVSIIIPSKDNAWMLSKCVDSIYKYTDYTNFEVIVVDNGSSAENRERVESLCHHLGMRYLYRPMDFNFSKMCNIGAQVARGEYLLFLNDDITLRQDNWLSLMLGQAMQPYAGAVGAKLYYPHGDSIQHAGVINIKTGPSHAFSRLSDEDVYYYGRNRLTYNYIAVTGACLMTARMKYDEIGGFDEQLGISYNDVDLCYSLFEHGYYNVLRNDVKLCHHESFSRGLDIKDDRKYMRLKRERGILNKKHPQLREKDPFYNVNLQQDGVEFKINMEVSDSKQDRRKRKF